jgi:hypothetical protein
LYSTCANWVIGMDGSSGSCIIIIIIHSITLRLAGSERDDFTREFALRLCLHILGGERGSDLTTAKRGVFVSFRPADVDRR